MNTALPKIIAAGLNPAWQKTLTFPLLRKDAVNRAASLTETASGKGINFVRACRTWGKAEAVVGQFAGGINGERLTSALDQEGIAHLTVRIPGNTRCCTTLLSEADHSTTELIEPSAAIPEEQVEEMFRMFAEAMKGTGGLALCGTFPPGVPENFYARLAAEAKKNGLFVFADAFKGVESLLEQGVDLLKINREELYSLAGTDTEQAAFDICFRKYAVKTIAVTDGKEPALLSCGGEILRFDVPYIETPVNPIGSGDSCSGVMLSEILSGSGEVAAFRAGLAAASANCLTAAPACFDRQTALSFL